MAFVVCPTHGGDGAVAVCPHVAERLLASQVIDEVLTPVTVVCEGATLGPTWLCPECAARFRVRAEGETFGGSDGLERYWVEIGFTPVCPQCFERARAGASST